MCVLLVFYSFSMSVSWNVAMFFSFVAFYLLAVSVFTFYCFVILIHLSLQSNCSFQDLVTTCLLQAVLLLPLCMCLYCGSKHTHTHIHLHYFPLLTLSLSSFRPYHPFEPNSLNCCLVLFHCSGMCLTNDLYRAKAHLVLFEFAHLGVRFCAFLLVTIANFCCI